MQGIDGMNFDQNSTGFNHLNEISLNLLDVIASVELYMSVIHLFIDWSHVKNPSF